MTLRDALASAISRLTAANVPSPRLNAELLLMFTLECDRAYLHAHPERKLSADEQRRYDQALTERERGVPAQYITGHQEFWGMDFIVTPAVLIPRPETEHVIETVLANVWGGRPRPPTPCASSMSAPVPAASRWPWPKNCPAPKSTPPIFHPRLSKSPAPTQPATNSKLASNSIKPTCCRGSSRSEFDFVVSNPPYVGESEEDQVQLEVRKYEPRNAVFAGATGLEVIERLIPQARESLKPGGWLVMEISGTIAERVRELLAGWNDVQITNDLQGIPRVASARTT